MFSRGKSTYQTPLRLYGNDLKYVDSVKFLGMIFDKKLQWKQQVEYIKKTCIEAVNLIKTVAHHDWGADSNTLFNMYQSLVRSRIEYGAVVYASASKTTLRPLEVIQNTALRLVTGAYRTSPVQSIRCLVGEPPLNVRREQLTLNYYVIRVLSTPHHPHSDLIKSTNYWNVFETRPHLPPPINIRVARILKHGNIPNLSTYTQKYPPWTQATPQTNIELTKYKKSQIHPEILQKNFAQITAQYNHHTLYFTDASKNERSIGCAVHHSNNTIKTRLPNTCSVYTGELYAIKMALEQILVGKVAKSVICTDSLSSIMAIRNMYPKNILVKQIRDQITELQQQNWQTTLIYTPSHVNIAGNEIADKQAKEAADLETYSIIDLNIAEDIKQDNKNVVIRKWQEEWDKGTSKLKHIKNKVTDKLPYPENRKAQVILSRLRIGHTKITHEFLLKNEPRPTCHVCSTPIDVGHIILDCPLYEEGRIRNNLPDSLERALGPYPENTRRVVKFLQDNELFNCI